MHMLYNSSNFAVMQFEVAPASAGQAVGDDAPSQLTRGGFEIVDKFLRKEVFLEGAMAQSFKEGVDALIETRPSEEEIDDFMERFTSLMHQPVVLH